MRHVYRRHKHIRVFRVLPWRPTFERMLDAKRPRSGSMTAVGRLEGM
jgi:hypothetical protein